MMVYAQWGNKPGTNQSVPKRNYLEKGRPDMIPAYGIEVFVLLVQQWVDAAFPQPRGTASATPGGLWWTLARALCGSDMQKFAPFGSEIAQLTLQGREGDPPIHALEQRLRELVNTGLQEGFLAVALRDATEDLIVRDCPTALNQWTQLADQLVPKGMRFSHRGDEITPSTGMYGPGL